MDTNMHNADGLSSRRDDTRIALFIDFENIALGIREAKYKTFDLDTILQRLVEKGKIVFKKAYSDWSTYSSYRRRFHEAGIELVEIPRKAISGKNSADIRMVVDAMDLSFSKDHIGTFVIASGDSDFSPLVSKLKENDKYVIGVGVKNSTSELLIENCDEFIFYEDIVRQTEQKKHRVTDKKIPKRTAEAFERILDAIDALLREDKEVIWGSMVKQTIKRKFPQFNESYYGYNSFSKLLEDAKRHNLLDLRKDQRSGTYIIETE